MRHAPVLAAVVDRERKLVRASDHFAEKFGAWEGRTCHDLCMARSVPCDPCSIEGAFDGGHPGRFRQTFWRDDGRSAVCEVAAVPLEQDAVRADHVLLIFEDRTEIVDLREEVAQGERLANVGLTAAGLAHTIKNILGGMEGAMYTVDTGLEKGDDARLRSGWEMVSNYIGQVNALVLNLLDYTRPTRSDRQEIKPEDLVAEVVELFGPRAELVGVSLSQRVEDGVPPIFVDGPVIHACLSNLVTNALDACMWDPDEDKEPEVRVVVGTSEADGVYFEVRDNGVGISEENQARILSLSFTTKGIRGTGLGLLLTRNAVEQHGGEITFGSEPGKGSWFRFELPRVTPTRSSPAASM